MIQKIASLFAVMALLVSCTDTIEPIHNPSSENGCRITSTKINTLIFDDVSITYFNLAFSGKFTFDYDNEGRINRVHGGLRQTGGLSGLSNWDLYDAVTDTIVYDEDRIIVTHSNNESARPYTKEYVINTGVLESRKISLINGFPVTKEYTYAYPTPNEIVESFNGNEYRTFTIEGGNLTKVVRNIYDAGNVLTGKEEWVFSGYDTSENLLKGKFYVNGAFYKAFSTNNYRVLQKATYVLEDGVMMESDFSLQTLTFGYAEDGTPDLFEKNCN